MSFWDWFWGRAPPTPPPVQREREQIPMTPIEDQLSDKNKRRQILEREIKLLHKEAREKKKSGNSKGALIALKKKKQREHALKQLYGIITNLENAEMAVDSAMTVNETVGAMKHSTNVISAQMNGLSVEDIQEVHKDLQDNTETVNEMMNAISADFSGMSPEDDEDIMRQLAEMDEEIQVEEATNIERMLPKPPTKAVENDNNNNNDGKLDPLAN